VTPRVRPMITPIEENSDRSESDGEENYRRGYQRSRQHHGLRTPLSKELEEIQWPHHLNPAVLPQFNGESDPEEFLLKYEPPYKQQQEALRVRRRHSSSRYEAWPSAGIQTSPPEA
jgi:hypothetical protein